MRLNECFYVVIHAVAFQHRGRSIRDVYEECFSPMDARKVRDVVSVSYMRLDFFCCALINKRVLLLQSIINSVAVSNFILQN